MSLIQNKNYAVDEQLTGIYRNDVNCVAMVVGLNLILPSHRLTELKL